MFKRKFFLKGLLVLILVFLFGFSFLKILKAISTQVLYDPSPANNDYCGWSVATGDFDGDGNEDIVMGCREDYDNGLPGRPGSVVTFRNGGIGSFSADFILKHPSPWHGDDCGSSVAVGDFNGDGKDDIVMGCVYDDFGSFTDAGSVVVFEKTATGFSTGTVLQHPSPHNLDYCGFSVTLGDFDNDGDDDIVMGCRGDDFNQGSAIVFKNNGGTFTNWAMLFHPSPASNDYCGDSVATGDFDNDGDKDIVIGCPGDDISQGSAIVFKNNGGTFTYWETLKHPSPDNYDKCGDSIAVGDFDGDGDDDIVMGCSGDNGIYGSAIVFKNNGGSFTYWATLTPPPPTYGQCGSSVATGDFDGDGDDDIVMGCYRDNTDQGSVVIFKSTGGSFSSGSVFYHPSPEASGTCGWAGDNCGRCGWSVTTGDFDGDGKDDVVMGCPHDDDTHADQGSVVVAPTPCNSDGDCDPGEDISNCPQDCCVDATYLSTNGLNPCDFKECLGITGVYGVPGLECGCDCDGTTCCDDPSSCNPLEGSASCKDCGPNPVCDCDNVCEINLGISEFSIPACPDCGGCTCLPDDGCKKGCTPPDPDCQNCTYTLTTFEGGVKELEIDLSTGVSEEAKIVLPMKSKICNAEVQAEASPELLEKRTPYAWVPLGGNTHDTSDDGIVQIKTEDGSFVSWFKNGEIWDCTGNCTSTNISSATWTKREDDPDCDFACGSPKKGPSRITVMGDKEIWVATRGCDKIVQIVRKDGCSGDQCYECKKTYTGSGFTNLRGITFDAMGNVWAGDYNPSGTSKICVFPAGGGGPICANTSCPAYGLIGDPFGYVWSSGGSGDKVCRCKFTGGSISCSVMVSGKETYGIIVDNEGDVWVGRQNWGSSIASQFANSMDPNPGKDITPSGLPGAPTHGIAVDGDNDIWVVSEDQNKLWVIDQNGSVIKTLGSIAPSGGPRGVAISINNGKYYGWLVSRSGYLIRIEKGTWAKKTINIDHSPYNYTDMTGFRTPSLSLGIGFIVYPGTGGTVQTFHFECPLYKALQDCNCPGCKKTSGPLWGREYCEVPLKVVATFARGKYTLKNLKIEYEPPPPIPLAGGLVPCGRHTDDPTTFIDETQKCTFCHLLILGKRIADFTFLKILPSFFVLFLAISGFLMIIHRPVLAKNLLKMFFIGAGIIFGIWFGIEILFFFLTPNPPFRDWTTAVCNVAPCDANGVCDTSKGETAQNCPSDCACNLAKSCGTNTKKCDFDGKCETDESIDGPGGQPESCPDCAKCGDNVIDIGEECDGTSLPKDEKGNVITCKNYGYSAGTLSCTPNCKIDFNGCHY